MASHPSPRLSPWAYLVLFATPLFFSSNMVFGRAALAAFQPASLAFWRWFIATLILVPLAAGGIPDLRRVAKLSPRLLLAGALGMGICGAGVYWSLEHTTATNGILIYTTSPAFVVLIEAITGQRKLQFASILGILLATIGVLVIVAHGSWNELLHLSFNIGDLGFVVAALSWALYSLVLRNRELIVLSGRAVFALTAAFGALVNLPLWIVEGTQFGFLPSSPDAWRSLAEIILFPSVLAFFGYQFSIRKVGAARASMFMYLLPIYGVGLAALFLGEEVAIYHVFGSVLTLGGVAVATLRWPKKREADA